MYTVPTRLRRARPLLGYFGGAENSGTPTVTLTDVAIRKAVIRDKAYKLSDSQGLHLFIKPTGSKLWRLKYRIDGKEKLLSFGPYPAITLAVARNLALEARQSIRIGLDPSRQKPDNPAPSFETVALDWLARNRDRWSERHCSDVAGSLAKEIFPKLGSFPIDAITVADVLRTLRAVEARDAIETAHRLRQRIGAIYAFAIASGLAIINPGESVKGALAAMPINKPQPAIIDLEQAKAMLKAVLTANAQPVTREAALLLALTAVRPGELRNARWDQFDTTADDPVWIIPAETMKGDKVRKAGDPHIVPLAPQAVACLNRLRPLTGSGPLVFPSQRHAQNPMSENAIGYLLNRAGFHGRQTAHGFRATFSSIMNERFPADRAVIDLMLAHSPTGHSASEGAYNRAKHMERRRELATEWANMLLQELIPNNI